MTKIRLLIALVLSCLISGVVLAQEGEGDVLVYRAWTRPTALERVEDADLSGVITGAFMEIENVGDENVRLSGVTSDAAAHVEIHETTMANDVMRMNAIEGIDIPARRTVGLRPREYHLMLMELNDDLLPGEAIALTLTFEAADGEPFDVTVGAVVTDALPVETALVVVNPWARATASAEAMDMATDEPMAESTGEPMMTDAVSAAYMRIANRGELADRLVSAASPIASIVEIHEMAMENDVMRMRPVDGLDIPASEAAVLEPGGYHIMLMGLVRDLLPGEAIPLTLTFESGVELTIAATVRDLAAAMNH